MALLCALGASTLLAGCGDGNATDATKNAGQGATGATGASASIGGGGTAGDETGGSSAAAAFDCTATLEPSELIEIPAGDFVMGCNEAVDGACDDDEKPMHTVSLSAYAIERSEVSRGQYTACVLAGACVAPSCDWDCDQPELPAGCVSFEQAQDYCAWAERRLPTEAEWEKAARGSEGAVYPWGDADPDCTLVNMAGCGDSLLAAGSLTAGASPYGVLDMAGNMVEMVADWYDASYYEDSPASDPTGPTSGERYGGRGGGFRSDAEWLRASKRDWYDLSDTAASLGFRCAR